MCIGQENIASVFWVLLSFITTAHVHWKLTSFAHLVTPTKEKIIWRSLPTLINLPRQFLTMYDSKLYSETLDLWIYCCSRSRWTLLCTPGVALNYQWLYSYMLVNLIRSGLLFLLYVHLCICAFVCFCVSCYLFSYPHKSRDSVSPVCRLFVKKQ